ncbi:HNH endonuclease domain-containing protein, RRXRR domain-containing [Desulfonema limicola]|uniref:HNH endonuclease domain-containing protein, RRXRR domain-containing n=1 Tax=Desulfonema limicola TaxID=45656 RepID=A0A975GFE4_9BACT|nr:RNA-guided endonuclease IscB [Desulfonema limicola]QTA79211.1 HNH endonuclease domain-containing protein, RRXRR domain-containing [Desulfonema limicola]
MINKNGNPLMPCKPAKARHLLDAGKAKVESLFPFTIRLMWDCEENTQPVIVGIDKGSHKTGFCCIGGNKIMLSGQIKHRTDIKNKMESRKANRRARRNRKWYRPPRFENRGSSKRSGRLPPSIKANVEEVIRVIKKIPLPVSEIIVEDVQIDIARLNNPELTGKMYQESSRLDENLRIAALMRDDYKCQNCNKKNIRLEAHHIIPRSMGGKDTIKNLITLCESCHEKVHDGEIEIKAGVSGFKDRIAQRTMQGKAYMYSELGRIAPVKKVFGYQTSEYRKSLNLPKDHDIDALCAAALIDKAVIPHDRKNFYEITFRAKQTRRIYHDLPRKNQGRVKYQLNETSGGFGKGDIVKVKNKWIKQINSIYSNGQLAFKRIKGEPASCTPKKCRLLKKNCSMIWWKIIL